MKCDCKLLSVSTISELKELSFEDFSDCVLCDKCDVLSIGELARNIGVTRLEARRINKSSSDNYTQALIHAGCDKELIFALSSKNCTKFFLENPQRLRELMEACAERNKCSIKKLSQRMLLNCPILKALIPSQLRLTSELKAKVFENTSMIQCCDVLPHRYFDRYPLQAREEFEALKKRICMINKWPTVEKIRKDSVGRKMMDHFGNSVSKMCNHFNEVHFQTHTAAQGNLNHLDYVKALIIAAVKRMGGSLNELPSITLRELERFTNGSVASASSRNHKTNFASLCIQLFPEYKFSPYQFTGGVENFHWVNQRGELMKENIRDAVLWLVTQITSKEEHGADLDMIRFLKKADFVSHGLSYIANLPNYTLAEVLSLSFPELDFSDFRRYGNDDCGERLYHLLHDYFDPQKNILISCLEDKLCFGQSGTCYLRTDLVIKFPEHKVHFEVQGPQHIDEVHSIHANSRYSDSFERQIKNDRIKFDHHQSNKNIIIYLKPEQLTNTAVLAETKRQGFDIVNGEYIPISKKNLANYLIKGGFLSSEVFAH
ncbi:hypothetical protein Q4574_07715 [Aliiglaciecola sp. 3_MG-2023]|uniref:hypothetical protein n=1 Tax=Aliiglaciecola sp. 3_MG-2023 TaxID=3062644 RepID=UPI0026E2760E|nr:hypothetical protein [Aliiglaciecola sp. 3_MG-2023]MDO6693168.1 hypothetical protein [Aliiglaciecola sp. 3_MG-2023]